MHLTSVATRPDVLLYTGDGNGDRARARTNGSNGKVNGHDTSDRTIAKVSAVQLRHLETFLAIVTEGTLTAAAASLHKTQGAVSHDLKTLEGILGLPVIDRSGQRIKLTSAGSLLLPHAQELTARARDAEDVMRRMARGEAAAVRIGATPSLARRVVRLIVGFRKEHPTVKFELVTGVDGRLGRSLTAGELDLVLAEIDARDGVGSLRLGEEEFRVILAEADPLAGASRLAYRQLGDRPFVGLARELGSSGVTHRFFAEADCWPEPAVEVCQFYLTLSLIRAGGGFSLLPVSVLDGTDGVVGVPADPTLRREIGANYSTRRVLSPMADEFLDYLAARWSD